MNRLLWPEFLAAIKQHVVPALGCTEPVAIALACATARRYLGEDPTKIRIDVSPNLFKNCMGVTVPGTGMQGVAVAAAVGALGGDADGGLEVLRTLTPERILAGQQLVDAGHVHVNVAAVDESLYVNATLYAQASYVRVTICGEHTKITCIEDNGEIVFTREADACASHTHYCADDFNFREIYDFALHAPFADIRFILQAKTLNQALSQEGLLGEYGLNVGQGLFVQKQAGFIDHSLHSDVIIFSSSASDARMGGALAPAMSNSGSGNQGIAATMPVVIVAEYLNADEEKTARALILSHLIAIYIHQGLPALSAFCAAATAAMGSAAAIGWLLTGEYSTSVNAVKNMVADVSGMFCDGASNSCALKVSSSASAALKSVLLAMNGRVVSTSDGIVANSIDGTITNLCAVASQGMHKADEEIINAIYRKCMAQ